MSDSNSTIQEAVEQATCEFYAALNAMFTGDIEPMKKVWSHADDVTYLGPDGVFRVGWQDVLEDWQAQADCHLGGTVNADNIHTILGRDVAVTQNYEIGENLNSEGQSEPVMLRSTSTFRHEEGAWKMVGHHTDLLPHLINKIAS